MSKKKPKRKPRLASRIRRLQEKRQAEVERLIVLAAEPVPPGSGVERYGRGPYEYVKQSTTDPGSLRAFRFRKTADARRAFEAGMTADAIAEGRLDELDTLLEQSGIRDPFPEPGPAWLDDRSPE